MQKLIDERTRYEREILSTRENLLKEAMNIAAVETRRRLDELNHAHELAAENWARSLPREMFEQFKDDNMKWRDGVTRALLKTDPYGEAIGTLQQRIGSLEMSANKVVGGFFVLGVMGLSGVAALALGLLRLAGIVQ
jgi:hypothetical protein